MKELYFLQPRRQVLFVFQMAATGEKTLGHSELKLSLIGDFHTGTLIG